MPDTFPDPNPLTSAMIEMLGRHPKRVVFPEGNDVRILQVAAELVRREAVLPILLGNRVEIRALAAEHGIPMQFVNVIEPAKSSDLPLFCERYVRMQRIRGMQIANPEETLSKPHYFAAMMVQYGQADALVAGNQLHPTAVYRPLLQMIKPLAGVPSPFGAALVLDDLAAQGERVLVFADCSMHVTPSTEQLAAIAVESGKLARHILGRPSKVAMLSHSTKGSAGSPSSRKVAAATALARERVAAQALEIEIEGEIQADVALVAAIAARKTETSVLRGEADVLVFPNLDAADISLRLLRHLAGFRTYGQLVLGLTRPAAQVPRAASVEHIFGTTVAVAVEAIKYHQIYPQGDGGEADW